PAPPTPAAHSCPTRRSSDLAAGHEAAREGGPRPEGHRQQATDPAPDRTFAGCEEKEETTEQLAEPSDGHCNDGASEEGAPMQSPDRKSTRLNSSHVKISYAV